MSIQAISWVWDHSTASGNDLLVFLALADFADGEGECWPHQEKVAQKSRLSLRTVQRAIEALVASGELQAFRTGRGNRYKLPMRQSDVIRQSCDVSDTTGLAGVIRHSCDVSDTPTVADAYNRQRTVNEPSGDNAPLGKSKANDGSRPQPTWVRPTNFVEDLDQLPEKQVEFDKTQGLTHLRILKGGQE